MILLLYPSYWILDSLFLLQPRAVLLQLREDTGTGRDGQPAGRPDDKTRKGGTGGQRMRKIVEDRDGALVGATKKAERAASEMTKGGSITFRRQGRYNRGQDNIVVVLSLPLSFLVLMTCRRFSPSQHCSSI